MPEPVRLANEEGVDRHTVDQRLLLRLLEHLVQGVDDHVGESLGGAVMQGDHRDVVHLVRVRHAQDAAAARLHPHRLVVDRPVEDVLVARLLQQVRRRLARIDTRRQPAGRRLSFVLADRPGHVGNQLALASLVEVVLVLGVGAAVADDLVAAPAEGGHYLRAVLVALAVEEQRYRQLELVEKLEEPPNPYAVAVLAPAPVVGVGMRQSRRVRDAEARCCRRTPPGSGTGETRGACRPASSNCGRSTIAE